MVVGNQIMATVLPGIQLIIGKKYYLRTNTFFTFYIAVEYFAQLKIAKLYFVQSNYYNRARCSIIIFSHKITF